MNREQSEQQKRQSSEVIAVVVVMVALVLILKIVCENEIYISYSYARSGSIKPRSLNRISFTKIRIQSTEKSNNNNPFTTWAIGWLTDWLVVPAKMNKRTYEHTMDSWNTITLYHIRIYHSYLWAMRCNVMCMCSHLFLYILYDVLLVRVCVLSSHQQWIDCVCVCVAWMT